MTWQDLWGVMSVESNLKSLRVSEILTPFGKPWRSFATEGALACTGTSVVALLLRTSVQ